MTYEIVCKACGTSLYSGFDLKSPADMLKSIDYKCRKCGVRLSASNYLVEVRKIDGSFA